MANASLDGLKASRKAWVSCLVGGEVESSASKITGYTVVEAESLERLQDAMMAHPHMMSAESTIDIFELASLPNA